MNRRDFIQFTLATSALALFSANSTALAQPARKSQPKRGLGIGFRKDDRWQEKLRSVGASWFYSWMHTAPADIPPGLEYVPMIFRRISDAQMDRSRDDIRENKSKFLLGFNEPDAEKQGNVTVEEALAFWPKLMALSLPLVSPACVHADKEWMTAFMKGVKERSLRVDFVAVHSYGGPNADALMRRLESVYKLYKRPIWLTEFGVGDWQAASREENRYGPQQVLAFMEQVLPRLDKAGFVHRYAWFPASQDNIPLGPCALFKDEDGSLTRLGECYRDL